MIFLSDNGDIYKRNCWWNIEYRPLKPGKRNIACDWLGEDIAKWIMITSCWPISNLDLKMVFEKVHEYYPIIWTDITLYNKLSNKGKFRKVF